MPNLRDAYVEGRRDLLFFKGLIDEIGARDVKIYEIKTVEILEEKDLELNLELKHNNRNKVIFLAHKLASLLLHDQVRCIADKDFDIILNKNYNCPMLLFSDYTCIEMYLFNEKTMTKFLEMVLGGFPRSAREVLLELSKILPEFFLIRLANKLLNLNMKWIDIDRCCECINCKICFNAIDYIERCLHKSLKFSKKKEFLSKIKEYIKKI